MYAPKIGDGPQTQSTGGKEDATQFTKRIFPSKRYTNPQTEIENGTPLDDFLDMPKILQRNTELRHQLSRTCFSPNDGLPHDCPGGA